MVLMIIASLFSFTVQATGLTINDVCEEKREGNRIAKPFEKTGKGKWCLQAVCNNSKEQVDREFCITQATGKPEEINPYQFTLTQRDLYTGGGSSGSRGSMIGKVEIFKPDACFEICKPEQQKALFSHKTVSGIEKPACLECLVKRPREGETYELLGKGVTLYKGQQCYYKCKPVGRENDMPVYSQECLDCAGLGNSQKSGGQPLPEKFYILDQKKTCYEVFDGQYQHVWPVPIVLCQKAKKVYGTFYEKESGYSIKTLVFGEEPRCMEYDDLTYGRYIKREVLPSRCQGSNVRDDERSSGKDVPQKSGSQKSSGAGAKRQ